MAKEYRVSLAVARLMNCEFHGIEAETKEEAFAKALEGFEKGEGEIDDDWSGSTLLNINGEMLDGAEADDFDGKIPQGVYIAELDEDGNETEV